MTAPRRGDVWLVAFGASRGGEPGKHRPAIVVSASQLHSGDPDDLVVVVPVSATRAPGTLRPALGVGDGVDRPSLAICRAIRSVATARLVEQLGSVRPKTLAEIERALTITLGLRTSAGEA